MLAPDDGLRRAIHLISGALSGPERRSLCYLCGSPDLDDGAAGVREMLLSRVTASGEGHVLLVALLQQLRRYDLLRRVLGTSREELDRSLRHRRALPRFRVLMANISEELDTEDLASVKFLLSRTLPHEKMEKIKSFLDVATELEKLDKVSPDRVDFVEECLRSVGRLDLARKVRVYMTSAVTPAQRSPQQSPQQRRRAVPCPTPAANGSHCVQQRRWNQPCHFAAEDIPASASTEHNCQRPIERYKFSSDPRGVCVIIDCVGNDGEMLENAFRSLHFDVVLHKWLSVDESLSALRLMSRQGVNCGADGFVCCIISRGTPRHLLGTDSYGAGLRLQEVRRLFTAAACPGLAGKPKLFFIQRYGVPEFQRWPGTDHRYPELETDGCDECDGSRGRTAVPEDADFLWSHCWTDEGQIQRGDHRSVYLKALTDALNSGQRRERSMLDVHTEVNGAVYEHNARHPGEEYHVELKHTLRKNLYV